MLFVRQDCVEEAWRIVEPYLKSDTPVYDFEPNSWVPAEVEQKILPAGGWHNPPKVEFRKVVGDFCSKSSYDYESEASYGLLFV